MDAKGYNPRRTYSLGLEDSLNISILARNREITNAINNRNPSSLLNMSFTKGSILTSRPVHDSADSSIHLRLLKGSIDSQRLSAGKGDKTMSFLRNELKLLELEEAKHDFWLKKSTQKAKDLQEMIEEAIRRQAEEMINQDIYNHLLKRMKKTKIFLEIKSTSLNDSLKLSDSVLSDEKKKHLVTKEAMSQAKSTCKGLERAIRREKYEGEYQISTLQVSIDKNVEVNERREQWKSHRVSMFEAAVIEDRNTKNIGLKEALSLHRLWFSVLTKIFERKKEKSQKLEGAFQRIKIATGIPEISLIVENFLTKEQTYEALMKTVSLKEVECSEYKKKIDELQTGVDNYSNRSEFNNTEIDGMKGVQEAKIRELIELSHKKFLIENIHSKVRTWMKLMIRKFYKILGKAAVEVKDEENLLYYLRMIGDIFRTTRDDKEEALGKAVEDRRKIAVIAMIKTISKIPHSFAEEEVLNEASLIAADEVEDKNNRNYS